MSDASTLVGKLWSYCSVLRDDGLSYQDYLEQLTFLLFLKMADELTKPPFNRPSIVPADLDWASLLSKHGAELETQYILILNELGREKGMLGVVFRKAQNRIQDPAKLERLIKDLIGGETWMTLDADVKGDAYEGLLEKNAADTKSGAGQYFTPRALIRAMVKVMRPQPDMKICDPACGTGGFFLLAYEYIVANNPHLDPDQKKYLRSGEFTGWEIVDNTARLCAMNLLLHGLESPDSDSPIHVDDALISDPGDRFDMVLTNPPFGKKSSMTIVNAEGQAEKQASDRAARRLLGIDLEQATQLRPARQDAAEDQWQSSRSRSRQRALRGRCWRDGSAQAPPRVRCPYSAALANRNLLRPGCESQCALLRPEACIRDTMDEGAMDLRHAHQPALHPEDESPEGQPISMTSCPATTPRTAPSEWSPSGSIGSPTRISWRGTRCLSTSSG